MSLLKKYVTEGFSLIKVDNSEKIIIKKSIIKNKEIEKIKTFEYISLAKIIAAFAVVILHTNGAFWSFNFSNYKRYWLSANIIECIFYFAVPFFALCIGATLLDFNEKYGLLKYYYRRIIKVVIPLLFWSFSLYFYRLYVLKNCSKVKLSFENLWNLYYKHKVYSIFGSFHTFLEGYMIIPLLAYVEKSKKLKIYLYCFFMLLITQAIIPYLIKLLNPNLEWVYHINAGYIIYIFAGYIKRKRIFIYILGIICLLIHIYGTKILTLKYKSIIKLHKGYLNLYSCSLFLFLKENTKILSMLINPVYINKIGSLTIGSFFMHMPIKDSYLKLFSVNKFSLEFRLFSGIIICFISLLITAIIKKIPILKYTVP